MERLNLNSTLTSLKARYLVRFNGKGLHITDVILMILEKLFKYSFYVTTVRRVLIAPWGRPWRSYKDKKLSWERVTYILKKDNGEEVKYESLNTLPLLYREVKPDQIIVIVLDTALGSIPDSYGTLCEKVDEAYRDFISNYLRLNLEDKVRVIVAPGVGRISTEAGEARYVEFRGTLIDFFYFTLFELSKMLVELENESKVYLDISHGINFMPTLTYRALNEILGVLAFTKRISLEIYNSDPVQQGVDQAIIHVVERRDSVQPRISAHPLARGGNCMLLATNVNDCNLSREISEVARIDGRELTHLNVFLSSIINGLPLALYKFYPDSAEMFRRLERVLDTWKGKITCSEGRLVERRVRFTEDFMRYVRLWVAARSLALARKEEVSLDELKQMSKRIFWYYGQQKLLISRTLGEISRELEDQPSLGWMPLGQALGKTTGKFSADNFLAHAGLEYNVTEVSKREDGKVLLRYSEAERDNIENAGLNGLFES